MFRKLPVQCRPDGADRFVQEHVDRYRITFGATQVPRGWLGTSLGNEISRRTDRRDAGDPLERKRRPILVPSIARPRC